jgi:hypothetical protein
MSPPAQFRLAVERRDLAAAGELFAEDIVFHSPVTFHPFIGRDTVIAQAMAERAAAAGLQTTRL